MTKRPYYGKNNELLQNIRGLILTYVMARFGIARKLVGCGCLVVAAIAVCGLLALTGLVKL